MVLLLRYFLGWLIGMARARQDLILEKLALRQQVLALPAKRPRHRLGTLDKLFWVMLRRAWSGWRGRSSWSRPRPWCVGTESASDCTGPRRGRVMGRRPLRKELRDLVFRMVAENPTWGAPRIHGELLKLGFKVSERAISRWVRRARRDPDPVRRWLVFLHNHRDAIAAMDCFTVLTFTFGVLYCFFIIGHDRRRILHCNVTRNPQALCPATALSMGVPGAGASIPNLRPGREVQCRCCGDRKDTGKPAAPDGLLQSVAERGCRALGWQYAGSFWTT